MADPTELVCEDCMAGDHESCRREGGYLDDDSNDRRCGCHLTAHRLDNRQIPPDITSQDEADAANSDG